MHERKTNLIRINKFKFLEHLTIFQDKKGCSFWHKNTAKDSNMYMCNFF
jgi:hypothetical protein